jgi:RNA polymerase sigma factor (sigma-70 family)
VSWKQADSLESRLEAELDGMFRFAYRLTGSRHDAEDLVQDVCARAIAAQPKLHGADEGRRWLFRVLYNCFVDGKRHERRSPFVRSGTCAEIAQEKFSETHNPESLAEQADLESAMARAWARLEPAQRALLMLRVEGYSLTEIHRITEIDKQALGMRLRRARLSFAKYLDQERTAPALQSVAGRQS